MAARCLHRIRSCYTITTKYAKEISSCSSRTQVICLNGQAESLESSRAGETNVSNLFLSGRQASNISAIFCPELDINDIIDNCSKISESLERRRTAVNLPALIENLKVIRTLKEQINIKSEERTNILADIKTLTSNGSDLMRKEMLIKRYKELKDQVKELNTTLWNYEEFTYPQLTRLPNCIHSDTPSQNQILTEHGNKYLFSFQTKSHVEIGKLSKSLKFSNVSPSAYYLCNLAAILELAICNYFADKMTIAGFVDVINPDFCKSMILEGCGKSQREMADYITLKGHQVGGQSLHLTGTAALEGFAASLSRIIVNNTSLPLQYFSVGRCYTSNGIQQNLFSVSQEVKVTAFVASTESKSMRHFSALVDIVEALYRAINLPFRSVKIAAHLLKPAESLRVEVDLWSPYENKFVNVAHVSLCNDYISRRLMMKHGSGRNAEGYLHVVEATITSVPVMIGCIMENMQTAEGNFSVPDAIKPYVNDIFTV